MMSKVSPSPSQLLMGYAHLRSVHLIVVTGTCRLLPHRADRCESRDAILRFSRSYFCIVRVQKG